jgi:mannose-6-phosphate isomerase-like protein (cupin superfamily)
MKMNLDACVVRLGEGEKVTPELADMLDDVEIGSIHICTLPPDKPAGLHYHDFDEYWLFIEGETRVALRSEEGETKRYSIGPGDLVATPKGVEHGHAPVSLTRYIQFSSKILPGSRSGHLSRQ